MKKKKREIQDEYQPDLSQASLSKNPLKNSLIDGELDGDRTNLGVDVGDLLDRAALAWPAMSSGDYAAISALA